MRTHVANRLGVLTASAQDSDNVKRIKYNLKMSSEQTKLAIKFVFLKCANSVMFMEKFVMLLYIAVNPLKDQAMWNSIHWSFSRRRWKPTRVYSPC
jgi:hypothetical protein